MKAVKGICKNLINTVIVCIMAAILFSVMTFCWLADTGNTFVMNFNSSTASAYFAGGNGSKEEPYKISTPVHMYNFAWLQYLGYFNLKDNFNNGRAQSFFELTGNIDMSSIAIPPIGTREYPFIGYFNGNGKTVYNVTVSNSEADFTRRPSTAQFQNNVLTMADSKFTNVDIVGLFGVTGDFNSFISSSYEQKDSTTGKKKTVLVNGVPTEIVVKNKEESSGTGTGTTTSNKLEPLPSGNTAENVVYYSGMNVNSMYIDKITVKSVSPKTLVGLAAGYISSTMQDVGVYRSKVSVSNTDGGVSGITTVKGTVKEYGTTISEYSLVGDYDEENVGWTEVPVEGSGDTTAWGGSIDMRTLNRRLSYISAKKRNGYETTDTGGFRVSLYYGGSSSEFYWNKKASSDLGVVYLNEKTILPINVDKKSMGLDSLDVTTEKDSDGKLRLAYEEQNTSNNNFRYNQYYKANTVEVVAENNTGYIVGSAYGTQTQQGSIRSRIQSVANGSYGGIFKSLGESVCPKSDAVFYEKEKFEMLTMVLGANGNYETYRIKDGVNGTATKTGLSEFVQKEYTDITLNLANKGAAYKSVRKEFDETMSGSNMAHGFHFMAQLPGGFTSSDKSGYITTAEAKLYNDKTKKLETISNYEFVKGGINFTVSEDGVIKTILGAYYQQSKKDNLFDLFKVERTSAGKVTKFTRIETIYKDQSGNLVYNPSDTTDLTLIFSFTELTKGVLNHAAAYYFEIPVSAGDYVIGAYKDSSNDSNSNKNTAYLMYLDIGANGEGESGDTVELPYTMQSVDFVSVPTGFDDNNIIQTVKTTDSAGNEKATYPAYKDVGFAVGSGTDTVYYKRKSYDSLPSGDGEIGTAVYFWRLNKTINVSGFPSSYVGNGGNDDETNAKWD